MKKTDIVFIEIPRYTGTPEEKPSKVHGHLPNLGLCSLAAVAEKDGYGAAIMDAAALQYSQREIVDEIERQHVTWVLFEDKALDGSEERRLRFTHPLVWEYLMKNFDPVPEGLPEDFLLLRRKTVLGVTPPAAMDGQRDA